MTNRSIYMTPKGVQKAKANLSKQLAEYAELCKERTVAHELSGDGWHDNPHFNRLQQLEADKTREINDINNVLANVRIVEINRAHRPTDAVRIGSLVQLTSLETGNQSQIVWEIVGYDESDIPNAMLAYNSPLGMQLIGKEEGEVVTIPTPSGTKSYLIDALYADEAPEVRT